ncbi:MAG: signal recognition particle protein [Gammaproteobacteria bacterium]|nr:signal recognition particle protein [Gammaproteobacteria bacterium]
MFEGLSNRLTKALRAVSGRARLTEDNIAGAVRQVRIALLEADVALSVVRSFTADVQQRAIGNEVTGSLDAGQAFLKIVHEELVRLMGEANDALSLAVTPPAVVLTAGLQGAGKTATVAKLARYLAERESKRVAVVSADVHRPAAIEQLETLAREAGVRFIPSRADEDPVAIAKRARGDAGTHLDDVLIVDTAGRLAIDEQMMEEIAAIHGVLEPIETLFVVDAMTGQDAATTAKAFDAALPLTGVVLAKADGDARGGAALSVRAVTGKPIKFLGVGEKTDALEAFHPDRIASRILGMGDVLTLIEDAERKVDRKKASRLARKIQKGSRFDLSDFRDQLRQMGSLGGMEGLMERLPGMDQLPPAAQAKMDGARFRRMEVIIDSMTPQERHFPDVINGSRKRRIANGSGTSVQDVNQLLKQHRQMQKTMRKVTRKGGMDRMMRGLAAAEGTTTGSLGRKPTKRRKQRR